MSTVTRPTDLPLHTAEDEVYTRRIVATADFATAMIETRNSIYTVVCRVADRVVVCPDGVVLLAHTVGFHDDMMWVYDAHGSLLLRTSRVITTHIIEN